MKSMLIMLAEQRGISDDKIATIVAGQRPSDLAPDEALPMTSHPLLSVTALFPN